MKLCQYEDSSRLLCIDCFIERKEIEDRRAESGVVGNTKEMRC